MGPLANYESEQYRSQWIIYKLMGAKNSVLFSFSNIMIDLSLLYREDKFWGYHIEM